MRVMIVEDEFLIAEEMAGILEDSGREVLGPAGSVAAAMELLADSTMPNVAVIDANLRGESSAPVAERMRELGIPFCVCTGYREADLKAQFGDVATLQKPIEPDALLRLVNDLAARAAGKRT